MKSQAKTDYSAINNRLNDDEELSSAEVIYIRKLMNRISRI